MLAALLRIAGYPKSRADELSIESAREIARAALAIALPANDRAKPALPAQEQR